FNLVMNAADALSSNRGVIHVYVDRISLERKIDRNSCSYDPTEYLRIEVIDNGSGIPEDLIAKVHQPFFTTKRGEGGNGLGLAIVFRTLKKAGGFVDIRSVLGLGTGVSVCLPISKDEYGELER
ncbi:MAG: hybrid sensor histidine kinase/response regulator, partial [Candidatus Omnitrophica bacterium]|nr:hybrid sensor histidine kinase/response regulator [Candidatus Omnitrophota bacterium]